MLRKQGAPSKVKFNVLYFPCHQCNKAGNCCPFPDKAQFYLSYNIRQEKYCKMEKTDSFTKVSSVKHFIYRTCCELGCNSIRKQRSRHDPAFLIQYVVSRCSISLKQKQREFIQSITTNIYSKPTEPKHERNKRSWKGQTYRVQSFQLHAN